MSNRVTPTPTGTPDHHDNSRHDNGGQQFEMSENTPSQGQRVMSPGGQSSEPPQTPHYQEDDNVIGERDASEAENHYSTEPFDDTASVGKESVDMALPTFEEADKNASDADSNFDETIKHKNNDYERIYTPALPKADNIEESRYQTPSPVESPRSDKSLEPDRESEHTPRVLPPVRGTFGQKMDSTHVLEHKDSPGQISTVSSSGPDILPPIGKNRVYPLQEDSLAVSEVRQRSVGAERSQGYARSRMNDFTLTEDQQKNKHEFVIGADENTEGPGCCGWLLYIFSLLLITISLPFSLIFTIKVVQEYERAVIFRLGRLPLGGAKGPGIFFIIPCIESYTKVDLRTVSFDVPPQEVLTKDSVTVSVDAVVYYRVSNPTVSVANVENAHHSTRLLAQTTLRNILGTKDMAQILSDRESISESMQSTLDEATERWGIKVERVEIKDVRLPVQLQRAMAAEAEAAREARAKVIAAEGEMRAAGALKGAADIMDKSSAALQLRYLQTLSSISAEKNSTIIFPLPIDIMNSFMNKSK